MITGESFFVGLAQIGLVIGGFAAVIEVFREQFSGGGAPIEVNDVAGAGAYNRARVEERYGLLLMAECLGALVFGCLLTYPLQAVIEGPPTWRWLSGGLAGFLIVDGVLQNKRAKRVKSAGHRGPRYPIFFNVFLGLSIGVAIVQIANLMSGSQATYVFGLLWLLFIVGLQFSLSAYRIVAPVDMSPRRE